MKKAIIFSVGFAGRAIYRKAKSEYEIIGFIDNNKNISGTKYDNITIYHVDDIKYLDFDLIFIGGIWGDSMEKQLLSFNISKTKIIRVPDYDISYSTDMREKATDDVIKKLDEFLMSKNIKYTLDCGSSLINVLRNKPLSYATDVDVAMLCRNDLNILKDELPTFFSNYDIKITYFNEDTLVAKRGEIRQIVISDNSDEKILIDIVALSYYGDYSVGVYFDKFYCLPKYLSQEIIRYKYKNFDFPIFKHYDKIFRLFYGDNYMTPVKKWSGSDYKNLITKEELEKLVNGK